MKILKKYNTLLQYTVDPFCFEKYSGITKSQHTSNHWSLGAKNSCILQYDIFFNAKNLSDGAYFVNYHNRFELHCLIENVETDAREIIQFKEEVNLSTQLLLMQNTLGYYHLLNFNPMILTSEKLSYQQYISRDTELSYEITNIKRVMGTLPPEEMSVEESNFLFNNYSQ